MKVGLHTLRWRVTYLKTSFQKCTCLELDWHRS